MSSDCCVPLRSCLKRNVREGKLWRAEHETAEEHQIHAACHLQERVFGRTELAQCIYTRVHCLLLYV
jgi:hypothetical protein